MQVSAEHSYQISEIQQPGLMEDECLTLAAQNNISALFCPLEGICGLDLHPENTTVLSIFSNKTCSVFVQNVASCSALIKRLENAG